MPATRRTIASVLIANRGEIACRIMRTANRLGIRTVAVYSDADAGGLHVEMAGSAVHIGPSPAAESYLDQTAILAAARHAGVDAVHPGYGFLSENADFAEACNAAGLIFIGPSASAIRAMGDKSRAKSLMAPAGVPLIPGYHGADQQPERLAAEAAAIGFPVLIKAVAGGGGRGMRIVQDAAAFLPALEAARRETLSAFGDDRILLEAFIARSRHIEVQIFADRGGDVVHLFDRDCSLQRRHQKVLEEAPAADLPAATRSAMRTAAVAAARAIAYEGAGTVEFILAADGRFYFLEMNTRLQVEHPVTEQITGQDLVEWQFHVAAGEPLPLAQSDIPCRGHAIEARLYAEDPTRGFLPAAGRLAYFHLSEGADGTRVDTGVRTGDEIGIYYDPMLAKLIATGGDRRQAIARLRRALGNVRIAGISTNLGFLARLAAHPDYLAGPVDTGFIERAGAELIPPEPVADPATIGLLTLFLLDQRRRAAQPPSRPRSDRYSPWSQANAWRLNAPASRQVVFNEGALEHRITATAYPRAGDTYATEWRLAFAGDHVDCRLVSVKDAEISAEIGQSRYQATIVIAEETIFVLRDGREFRFGQIDRLAGSGGDDQIAGALIAPMPGRVTQVNVTVGESVERGQTLLVIEAMKMEHMVIAPSDGIVGALHFGAGDQVTEAAELLRIDQPPDQ